MKFKDETVSVLVCMCNYIIVLYVYKTRQLQNRDAVPTDLLVTRLGETSLTACSPSFKRETATGPQPRLMLEGAVLDNVCA